LEVESKKQLIERYSNQQYQTRKNEEFRALAHEIDTTKAAIYELENQILEIMEQTETGQKSISAAHKAATGAKTLAEEQTATLNDRERNLQAELASLETNRNELAAVVEETTLARYERMAKSKGENVIVGIERGVCGGCHMRLSRQTVVECRAEQNIVNCINCGRILYYTPDMDVAVVD
jgi:predicted  nucleic acid-binding Zn-ribbon protein